jgi:DNA repair exonuclease SbcCD ATPase subunit
MSNYQKIPLLNICSLNNFPFIEADFDAVTYYQLLCKIVESVNSTIELTNNLLDEYEEMEDEYNRLIALVNELQTRLDRIQEELTEYIDLKSAETKAELEAEINALSTELRSEVADAIALVNTTLQEFRTEVTELEDYVNDQILNFKNYTDSKFSLLDAKYTLITNDLQNQINQIPDSIPTVYNPASGNNESLQTAINDFWRLLRSPESLSAVEVDALEISAIDIDNLNESAINIDLMTRSILTNI